MRDPGTGLLGNTLHTDDAEWSRKDSGIGAGIDSFYEYLLKVAYLHCPDCLQVLYTLLCQQPTPVHQSANIVELVIHPPVCCWQSS